MKEYKVVKGKIKSKNDIQLIMDELNIPYINISPNKENKKVFNWVQDQVKDGFKCDLFYYNPSRILDPTELPDGNILKVGVLDWEFNSDEIKNVAELQDCPLETIKIIKLKDLRKDK